MNNMFSPGRGGNHVLGNSARVELTGIQMGPRQIRVTAEQSAIGLSRKILHLRMYPSILEIVGIIEVAARQSSNPRTLRGIQSRRARAPKSLSCGRPALGQTAASFEALLVPARHERRQIGALLAAPNGYAVDRATVRQKKTGRPVKFELTDQTRQAVHDFLKVSR